jgi:hypothetical protein
LKFSSFVRRRAAAAQQHPVGGREEVGLCVGERDQLAAEDPARGKAASSGSSAVMF